MGGAGGEGDGLEEVFFLFVGELSGDFEPGAHGLELVVLGGDGRGFHKNNIGL